MSILLALLVIIGNVVFSPIDAAADLGDMGRITLDKRVNDQSSVSGVRPGDSFTYTFLVGCDDNPCIDAQLTDTLPAEFAGFVIDNLTVSPSTVPPQVQLDLTGCSVGGTVSAGCQLRADFNAPLGTIATQPQFGIDAGATYRVSLELSVPTDLGPTWTSNGVAVANTATATATNSANASDTAHVTVSIPYEVSVDTTKTWSADTALYSPGSTASFTIGAANTSNTAASQITLQDPMAAADGAAGLATTNPFRYVDFDGLCSPSTLPAGATAVRVDLYAKSPGGTWNWVNGTEAATPTLPMVGAAEIGGVRFTYTSSSGATITANGAASSQCIATTQRATDRTSGATLVDGSSVANTATAALTVPGRPVVNDSASDTLTITGLNVDVVAGKTISPRQVAAGGAFTVAVSARNESNGPLDSLTLTEPGGSVGFLDDDLVFDSFTNWTWPTGATAANFTWVLDSGPTAAVELTPTSPAPTAPSAGEVRGFTITYTGAIAAGTTAGMRFAVTTDVETVPLGETSLTFPNTVGVSGTNAAGTDSDSATDRVDVYYPTIEISTDKQIRPDIVTPGGTVLVSLPTETAANRPTVNPNTIVVTDVWDNTDDTSFWNAFESRGIAFTDVPSGAELEIQVATGTPPAITWTTLASGVTSMYSNDLTAGPVDRDDIVGFKFTYTKASGFAQGTIVQPNLIFEASSTLRTGGPSTITEGTPVDYDNEVTAQATGTAGNVPVASSTQSASDDVSVVSYGSGGDGTIISQKRWVRSNWTGDLNTLNSQSGASAWTTHGWGVTIPGYTSVVLSDPSPNGESNPADTVFQAFDLTAIRAVTFVQDPLLRWDIVSSVELYQSGSWVTVPAPSGSWMSTTGFKGLTLSAAQSAATTGVRVTIVENTAARNASTDPFRPAPGSGVASSAAPRPFHMTWRLRNASRVTSPDAWVTAESALNGGEGTARNTFRVAGIAATTANHRDSRDDLLLVDTPPGVDVAKTVSPSSVVVPFPGDVPAAAYPTVDMTIKAWNTSSARASYIRLSEPIPCSTSSSCVTAGSDHSPDVFSGEAYEPASNPFERFDITGVDFTVPAAMAVDPSATQVALWHYDPVGGSTSVSTTTMSNLDSLSATALSDVVGIGIVYQSTNPTVTGGLFPTGTATANNVTMTLHTRLRATLRSDNADQAGGVTVTNDVLVQGFDPVLSPTATPNGEDDADVELRGARLDVTASKSISPATIYETNRGVPVTVTLGATDGSATMGAETATITDDDSEFWGSFEFVGLGSVTRPAGADLVRVDVLVNGGTDWVTGTAAATPALPSGIAASEITGVRFVFSNSPNRTFSATVPSADWTASASVQVVLRDGIAFPATVDNTVNTESTHHGYDAASASSNASVTLSKGTPRMDLAKDPQTGSNSKIIEPGEPIPWTLRFTNTGNAYIPVTSVTDNLGGYLSWDGSEPQYSSTGSLPTTGIAMSQPSPEKLLFEFPANSVMAPGDSFTITVGISLEPGLFSGQWATNSFTVDTGVTFGTGGCTNTAGNAQGVLSGLPDNECGTSNAVGPVGGALLMAHKAVRGDIDSPVVSGAVNITNPALPCTPDAGGFYSTKCAALSAIGSTDEWKVSAINSGTEPYVRTTIVDVLPHENDRLLGTGAARGSQWRPVLDAGFGVVPVSPLPAGAILTVEVTDDLAACVGSGPGSAWPSDPKCTYTPAAPAWTELSAFTGDPASIAALRISVDWTGTTQLMLNPGERIDFLYRTTNVPRVDDLPTPGAVVPSPWTAASAQRAWNQVGITADLPAGGRIARAPQRTAVQLLTGSLEVTKLVEGRTSLAPEAIEFELECTVPDGNGGAAAVDLGGQSRIVVPVGQSSRIDGLPLGATCRASESGDLHDWNETSREPNQSQTIEITEPGAPADPVPTAQSMEFSNRYDYGDLEITKVIDGNLPKGATGEFGVTVACTWTPGDEPVAVALPDDGNLTLSPANDLKARIENIPAGSECQITETDSAGADAVRYSPSGGRVTVASEQTSTVEVTNVYEPPSVRPSGNGGNGSGGNRSGGTDGGGATEGESVVNPSGGSPTSPASAEAAMESSPLAFTGGSVLWLLAAAAAALGSGIVLLFRRRKVLGTT